jgi:hypothetical protein
VQGQSLLTWNSSCVVLATILILSPIFCSLHFLLWCCWSSTQMQLSGFVSLFLFVARCTSWVAIVIFLVLKEMALKTILSYSNLVTKMQIIFYIVYSMVGLRFLLKDKSVENYRKGSQYHNLKWEKLVNTLSLGLKCGTQMSSLISLD